MDNAQLQQKRELYRFGAFLLDAAERRLWRGDEPVPLKPKQFDLLFYFVENAGRVTKKSELLDAVWADTYVEETTLARNVSWLRQKLGESFIETVPKLGYRFTAEVTRSERDENALIVEEQTVQYFRGEETFTLDDIFADDEKEDEESERKENGENTSFPPSNSPRHSASVFSLLFAALGLVALAALGITLYRNSSKTVDDSNVLSKTTVKNIRIGAALEAVDTGIQVQPGGIIDVSADGQYQSETNRSWTFEGDKTAEAAAGYTFQNAAPYSLVGWVGNETGGQNDYFQVGKSGAVTADAGGSLYFAVNDRKNDYADNGGELVVSVTITQRAALGSSEIKIGSVVNLQNRNPDGGGYLDAWGLVRNKPEFRQVPTETMFVSTHRNPNRENGSGSWEIVSATGGKNNETLVYGDRIHLRSRHPDADYLDNCGWMIDMPIFKDFAETQKFAVFTTYAKDRDNGTGVWIVKSNHKPDGEPVLEGDGIALENAFPGGGYLNTAGSVKGIPAFNDYDGSLLVFIHESSESRPDAGIWTITTSKATLK